MRTHSFSLISLCVLGLSGAADTPLWTEFLAAKKSGTTSLLPDFSYAGYAHGEKPIPTVAGPVFRVRDFGAIPDDENPDDEAVQKAVDAAGAAGGGVVLFEKGTYLINTDEATATAARVLLKQSGVVLRGVGPDEGSGTILYSPVQMLPENPKNMWSGRSPIVASGFKYGTRKAKVTTAAALNAMKITVDKAEGWKPGNRIRLNMSRKGAKGASFVDPHEWDDKWTSGISVREFHEITSVDGNTLTLGEPLMIPIDNGGDWTIMDVSFLSNIGFENLRFKGNWKEKFVHHRSWRDDSAWRGIAISGLENSWVRNCVFEDMNWALHISGSRQMTCENIRIIGTPAHFGMQVTGTYGIASIGVLDESGEHHGPSLQSGSCATVYHRCSWRPNGSFDSHANNAYATLHDNNTGGMVLSGVGGSVDNFPHHLHGLVFWNQNLNGKSDKPTDFWSYGKGGYGSTFVQVLFAGLHGERQEMVPESVSRNEGEGDIVSPGSLWLAQVQLRLGTIPVHLQSQGK